MRYDGDDDKNSSAIPSNGLLLLVDFPDLVRCGGTGRDVTVAVVVDVDVAIVAVVCGPVGGGAETGAGTDSGS